MEHNKNRTIEMLTLLNPYRRFFICLVALLCVCISQLSLSQTDFEKELQEERAWAGLMSKTIQSNEIHWVYSEGGSIQKPTIILIHGLSGTRDNWNRVARYLTYHYHVIIPDLPVHGDTQVKDDFDLSIANLTEKLRRFVEALKINPNVHVAGHSMGGAIALLYAAQYPTEVKSLLLVDSAGMYKAANTPYLKDPSYLKNIVVKQKGDFDRVMKEVMVKPPFIPSYLKSAQESMMLSQAKNTNKMVDELVKMSKWYTPESFALAAKGIDAPTYIVWGKQDKIINVEVAAELKSLLKNAEQPLILEGVGHMPLLEAEQLMVEPYLKFLKKHN